MNLLFHFLLHLMTVYPFVLDLQNMINLQDPALGLELPSNSFVFAIQFYPSILVSHDSDINFSSMS